MGSMSRYRKTEKDEHERQCQQALATIERAQQCGDKHLASIARALASGLDGRRAVPWDDGLFRRIEDNIPEPPRPTAGRFEIHFETSFDLSACFRIWCDYDREDHGDVVASVPVRIRYDVEHNVKALIEAEGRATIILHALAAADALVPYCSEPVCPREALPDGERCDRHDAQKGAQSA